MIGFAHAAATDMPLAAAFADRAARVVRLVRERTARLSRRFLFFSCAGHFGQRAGRACACRRLSFFFLSRPNGTGARFCARSGCRALLSIFRALPWYVVVQLRNPEFFRFFILEHNLARFSQDVYHHRQPFWFYLPVFLLALMPWTLALIVAVAERVGSLVRRQKQPFLARKIPGHCFF